MMEATMSTLLPAAFLAWCADTAGYVAIELLTCGADGWPHLAHLSVGEVLIDPAGQIRLALWHYSQGSANLTENGRACLMVALPAGVFEIRLQRTDWADRPDLPGLRAFRLGVVEVRDKTAPYAEIVDGLRFRLKDPDAAHERWGRVHEVLSLAFA
jgi:hypothetical protein